MLIFRKKPHLPDLVVVAVGTTSSASDDALSSRVESISISSPSSLDGMSRAVEVEPILEGIWLDTVLLYVFPLIGT